VYLINFYKEKVKNSNQYLKQCKKQYRFLSGDLAFMERATRGLLRLFKFPIRNFSREQSELDI